MRKGLLAVAALAVLLMTGMGAAKAANIPETDEAIRLPVNEWTGQHISAHISGEILKKMGYDVEYVTAGALPQFAAIAQGDLDFQPEVWTNSVADIYPKAIEKGDIIVLGQLGLQPQEGWIYPPYMEEKCPGLPDYRALYDCAQAFATAETFPKGRLITYPADWGTRSKDVVKAIGVPFETVAGGSEGAMIAELKSAVAAEEPILMMFWQPHWLFAQYDLNWVKWNEVEGECVEETQSKDTACGFQQASVDKIVHKGVKSKWPAAYRFMDFFKLDNDIHNSLILEIDEKGRPLEEVVNEWLEQNESTWQQWVDAAMM